MSKIVYVDDDLPGITRRRHGKGWSYTAPDGSKIANRAETDRLNALGVPPAWRDVWLCPSPHGHIQATGYDEKDRKQYRYRAEFRAQRETEKYERCIEFGRKLPLVRARVASDMEATSLDRDAVLAAVVRLLDLGKVRIGNRSYTKTNKSFGATTLRERHVEVGRTRVQLEYRAKSGKERRVAINDGSLARMVRRCQDLPGQALFQYIDADGERRPIGSSDVNDYIRDAMGGEFTAKHFRTWGASALAFKILAEAGDKAITLTEMLEPVAEMLGNTPAISRRSYVHPELVELCKSDAADYFGDLLLPPKTKYLSRHERGLIALLDN
ncbi:DNA topoisomerase IB [Parasphingopyxis algicola]|uniref:DNA topoisomerase IB n=1 Tax=Parasphingopyxis algicola TaxID=2026624 RepID=UPI00159FDA80|nr:DNA topoisomerase IB [Parasphingopyxis algicola]QLC26694.1 DNA topoisomerase IB [Parasphingopyxis algicola]